VALPGLPRIALANLFSFLAFSFTSLLRVLDICFCTFNLAPLASCRDLRRFYVRNDDEPELDLAPLQGLMPKLEVKRGRRLEYVDARDL
jgi:hypothetical protein